MFTCALRLRQLDGTDGRQEEHSAYQALPIREDGLRAFGFSATLVL
jgi:hypothetical protein